MALLMLSGRLRSQPRVRTRCLGFSGRRPERGWPDGTIEDIVDAVSRWRSSVVKQPFFGFLIIFSFHFKPLGP
jgi:hypothetical protein